MKDFSNTLLFKLHSYLGGEVEIVTVDKIRFRGLIGGKPQDISILPERRKLVVRFVLLVEERDGRWINAKIDYTLTFDLLSSKSEINDKDKIVSLVSDMGEIITFYPPEMGILDVAKIIKSLNKD